MKSIVGAVLAAGTIVVLAPQAALAATPAEPSPAAATAPAGLGASPAASPATSLAADPAGPATGAPAADPAADPARRRAAGQARAERNGGPATPAPARPAAYPSLPAAFDNVGITEDSDPAAGNLDGSGRSFSGRDLTAAGWPPGARIVIGGTAFTWPDVAPGRPDNVVARGQTVGVRGRGRALSFLVTGTGGAAGGTGVIAYADGTRQPYTLTAPDWTDGPAATKAVALPHRNTPEGSEATPVRVYSVSVPLDPRRPVRAVTLPVTGPVPDPALHVFALGVRPDGWNATWTASTSGYVTVGPWVEQTRRMVVHTSVGGNLTRIRLENSFADRPLLIGRVTVAVQAAGAAAADRPVRVTFGARTETTIPAGGQAISDPVPFAVPADRNLLVSLFLPAPVETAPVHALETQTSYATAPGAGDHAADTAADAYTESYGYWNVLSGVDVLTGPGTVVALGDSITDGYASTRDANQRWPNHLATRLLAQHAVPRFGVVNAGISGNKLVSDRFTGTGPSTDVRGVSGLHRLDRDVLAQPGARTVIVLEGINDLRGDTTADQVIAGLREVAARARAHGLRVLAGTLTPCLGWPDCTPAVDAKRRAVNDYLRGAVRAGGTGTRAAADGRAGRGDFDAIIDFDAVTRDPADPSRFLPAYDCGDHLHPNDAGYRAMAAAIDLDALVPRAAAA